MFLIDEKSLYFLRVIKILDEMKCGDNFGEKKDSF